MGADAMILVFWILSFKPAFSLSSFTFIKKLFSSSWLSAIGVVSFAYLRLIEEDTIGVYGNTVVSPTDTEPVLVESSIY